MPTERDDSANAADERPHHSDSDESSDAHDGESRRLRTSDDIRRHDTETIGAEEEAERLLAGEEKPGLGRVFRGQRKQQQPRSRRKDRWRDDTGERELMYKVEEGSRSGRSSMQSSPNSSEMDMATFAELQSTRQRGSICGRLAAIHVVIIVAFLALLFGAYKASYSLAGQQKANKLGISPGILSNGTHDFSPTTILISLDGFRADFLHRGLTPTLSSFVKQGVSPRYMLPSFPSLTFPNHFTLVTGMHPESHGIVGNNFWDPNMHEEFDRSMNPLFWNAEPLWETAELQKVRTAIHMWPGSEAHIGTIEPTYVDKFNMHEPLDRKVNRILGWLDLPGPNDTNAMPASPRPVCFMPRAPERHYMGPECFADSNVQQLIAAYVPNVDTDGHAFGPNSSYIRSTIAEVDGMLGSLFTGIEDRNLTDIVMLWWSLTMAWLPLQMNV